MGTTTIPLAAWSTVWRGLWQKLAPRCGHRQCARPHGLWRRVRNRPFGTRMHGVWYCMPECLEHALTEVLRRARVAAAGAFAPPHRIPLGLQLLSRQQLTAEQLRAALQAQRVAGRGRIGEWLQTLGFATEQQVTAALARQWACPVLQVEPAPLQSRRLPVVPLSLLEACHMIPVDFVEATSTLHIAFGEGIDYGVLYALEQMLGCHTEACLIRPSALRRSLRPLLEQRDPAEVVFDRVADGAEFARIIRSYATRLAASEIRLVPCGPHIWIRLERPPLDAVNLLLRAPLEPTGAALAPWFPAVLPAV